MVATGHLVSAELFSGGHIISHGEWILLERSGTLIRSQEGSESPGSYKPINTPREWQSFVLAPQLVTYWVAFVLQQIVSIGGVPPTTWIGSEHSVLLDGARRRQQSEAHLAPALTTLRKAFA